MCELQYINSYMINEKDERRKKYRFANQFFFISLADDAKSSGCSCPCHTPEVLANYHDSLIQCGKKKHRYRKT